MERAVWTPFKDLFETLKELASNESPALFKQAKDTLQNHKPEFYSLLKNVVSSWLFDQQPVHIHLIDSPFLMRLE